MKKIWRGIKGCWHYCWGHLFRAMFYDKKYFTGRWFEGKFNGLAAIGWEWTCRSAWARIRKRKNITAKYPIGPDAIVTEPEKVTFHPDDLNNFQGVGTYFQSIGQISIGKGSYIAPNVGIITSNHNIYDLDEHDAPKDVIIGDRCWIGMNAVVLPGVVLGPQTIVGAGAVVTKSFPQGKCIIAGNPAKLIREI